MKLSIIIPHYNSVDLLLNLLETIPNEHDIEVIIVDDRSTCSLELVEVYLEDKSNMFLYVNENGKKGAGTCRNIGLTKARGEWLLFADSDDFFMDAWSEVVKSYWNSDQDLIYFTPYGIELETRKESKRHLYYKDLIQSYRSKKSLRAEVLLKSGFCTPWSKLYRGQMVIDQDIWFEEVLVSNDIMFSTKCAMEAKKFEVSDQSIYCVTRGAQTLTSSKNKDNYMTRVRVYINRYLYLQEKLTKKEFKYAQLNRYGIAMLVTILMERWGMKMFHNVMVIYKANGIKLFSLNLFNPFLHATVIKRQCEWWLEIIKSRKIR